MRQLFIFLLFGLVHAFTGTLTISFPNGPNFVSGLDTSADLRWVRTGRTDGSTDALDLIMVTSKDSKSVDGVSMPSNVNLNFDETGDVQIPIPKTLGAYAVLVFLESIVEVSGSVDLSNPETFANFTVLPAGSDTGSTTTTTSTTSSTTSQTSQDSLINTTTSPTTTTTSPITTTSQTTTTSPTTTPTPNPNATPNPNTPSSQTSSDASSVSQTPAAATSSDSSSMKKYIIIGVVVGIVFGLILMLLLVFCWKRYRRRKRLLFTPRETVQTDWEESQRAWPTSLLLQPSTTGTTSSVPSVPRQKRQQSDSAPEDSYISSEPPPAYATL